MPETVFAGFHRLRLAKRFLRTARKDVRTACFPIVTILTATCNVRLLAFTGFLNPALSGRAAWFLSGRPRRFNNGQTEVGNSEKSWPVTVNNEFDYFVRQQFHPEHTGRKVIRERASVASPDCFHSCFRLLDSRDNLAAGRSESDRFASDEFSAGHW